jgi:hypothetical protein
VSAGDVVAACLRAGATLTAEGGRLRYRAPAGALTPALRAALAEHKGAVIRMLTATLAADGWATCPCGRRYYGAAGRPNICNVCRKVRDGEPVPRWLGATTAGLAAGDD